MHDCHVNGCSGRDPSLHACALGLGTHRSRSARSGRSGYEICGDVERDMKKDPRTGRFLAASTSVPSSASRRSSPAWGTMMTIESRRQGLPGTEPVTWPSPSMSKT